ncbi:hypothetical protein VTN00DRAFT_2114 [Thermoascus crustaceus]|uniref:uncharacterized protein n=1 Tax=Thermoascus crustaceus TaxID=5088 RepID=UPI0037443C9E
MLRCWPAQPHRPARGSAASPPGVVISSSPPSGRLSSCLLFPDRSSTHATPFLDLTPWSSPPQALDHPDLSYVRSTIYQPVFPILFSTIR